MPGKVCTASLLPLDQPVPFKDILPSLGTSWPSCYSRQGKLPTEGTPWAADAESVCFCFLFTPFISTNPKRCSSSFSCTGSH